MESGSQEVLNTTSRIHLKKAEALGNAAYAQKETTSRVIVVSRPN
jgi:hypothetical protein